MRKALVVINQLKRKGLIKDYAIGGGIATIFYTEPVFTYDLDVFVIPKIERKGLILLTDIFEYLQQKGYQWKGEHIVIGDTPVQFIVASELEAEAIENARNIVYKKVNTKVMSPEYLIAVLLKAGRGKDMVKIHLLLNQTSVNRDKLTSILNKYNLLDKFRLYGQ